MAYTPTTAQIQQIRLDVGDQTAPLIFGYVAYSSFYDASEGDMALTVYTALTRMIGVLTQRLAAYAMPCEKDALKARLEALKAMLDYWQQQAGVYGGSIRVGVLSYDIDTDEDNWDFDYS